MHWCINYFCGALHFYQVFKICLNIKSVENKFQREIRQDLSEASKNAGEIAFIKRLYLRLYLRTMNEVGIFF